MPANGERSNIARMPATTAKQNDDASVLPCGRAVDPQGTVVTKEEGSGG